MTTASGARPEVVPDQLWCRVTVLDRDGTPVVHRALGGPGEPDLGTVDEIARIQLLADRIGGRAVLSSVTPLLSGLFELAGLPVEVEG